MAGGMTLAFMQEDFLAYLFVCLFRSRSRMGSGRN